MGSFGGFYLFPDTALLSGLGYQNGYLVVGQGQSQLR